MSAHMKNAAETRMKLAYLTKGYMPDARWMVEGAFRFDRTLIQLANLFSTEFTIRQFNSIAGVVPCLWSLDWFQQRRPLGGVEYIRQVETYMKLNIGLTLVFDNPFIREADMNDPYALFLVSELAKRNSAHRHAVCVANDRLAELLRRHAPALPIYCHANRLLIEPAETVRDGAFYNKLARLYNRVCLHPADAVNPAVFTAIAEPARMDVVINDSCLRSCPLRREHLQVLAAYRREPYAPMHGQRRVAILNQVGCLRTDAGTLHQKKAGNLTKAECRALYEAGYRSFIIQSHQFSNEVTLMWDVIQSMFEATPDLSNKIALLNASVLSRLNPQPKIISSGLGAFAVSKYD